MSLRYPPSRAVRCVGLGLRLAAPPSRSRVRSFHATAFRRGDSTKNHYEILNVPPDASPAEIKKSFYQLSKSHHPDHNPEDPAAPQRFMRISEAYGVLSHTEKRAKYDRDVLRRHASSAHGHARKGSYHSTNPAGGRPASGLSRRRGTFTGPPPSFFRSGGWGAQEEKRRAAHEESTGGAASRGSGAGTGTNPETGFETGARTTTGQWSGMGPGQDPYGHRDDVPHFDREGHERTGQAEDARRAYRARRSKAFEPQDMGVAQGFIVIAGILGIAIVAPVLLFGGWWKTETKGGKKRSGLN